MPSTIPCNADGEVANCSLLIVDSKSVSKKSWLQLVNVKDATINDNIIFFIFLKFYV